MKTRQRELIIIGALSVGAEMTGAQLIEATGLWFSFFETVFRLEGAGLVKSRWADLRPGRRYRQRLYSLA